MSVEIQFKNGLLYTCIELMHEGKSITVNDVIIDIGAFHLKQEMVWKNHTKIMVWKWCEIIKTPALKQVQTLMFIAMVTHTGIGNIVF